eukprot:scaffold5846_cov160-Chaetoceros_neogracile.AAC.1
MQGRASYYSYEELYHFPLLFPLFTYSLAHLCCHYKALCDCSLANRPMNLDSSPFAAVDDTEINQSELNKNDLSKFPFDIL